MKPAQYNTKRQKLEIMRAQLDNEAATFLSHWKDLGSFIYPRRPRFSVTDVNRGDRRNQNIVDSTATLSARTLRSGMMSGITSPARPWFRLTTPDPQLADFSPVKQWLYTVDQRMSTVFLRSNVYNCLPIMYGDLGTFGTSAMIVEEDFDSVIRCYPFAIGSYRLANDYRLRVNTFFREFQLTVGQMVEQFGRQPNGNIDWTVFSPYIKNYWDRGEHQSWVLIRHFISPNDEYDPGQIHSKFKKYSSCYYEAGFMGGQGYTLGDGNVYLRESGYDYFPVLAPRWEVNSHDVYGTTCPGMDALGDVKALQLMQRRKAQAVEKMVNPPMQGPVSLRNTKATILPGDVTYIDVREGQQGFRPTHEVNPRIQELMLDVKDHQERIRRCFFEDLFLMLSQSDRREITAREIDERHEEKLLALGPVLEQLNQDLLDPLIDNTFDIMLRQGLIPKPPEELHGVPLKVEYISVMAQAQKMVGLAGMERFTGYVGQIAAWHPEVVDKVNTDALVETYGDSTSIAPKIIRSDDEANAIRQQRAQAQQAAQTAQNIGTAATAAKDLSQADMGGDSALSRLLGGPEAAAVH